MTREKIKQMDSLLKKGIHVIKYRLSFTKICLEEIKNIFAWKVSQWFCWKTEKSYLQKHHTVFLLNCFSLLSVY